jgi:hypothetical protein
MSELRFASSGLRAVQHVSGSVCRWRMSVWVLDQWLLVVLQERVQMAVLRMLLRQPIPAVLSLLWANVHQVRRQHLPMLMSAARGGLVMAAAVIATVSGVAVGRLVAQSTWSPDLVWLVGLAGTSLLIGASTLASP